MIKESKKITPEKAVTFLNKQGVVINVAEAAAVLNFMYLLADIYLYDQEDV